MSDELDPDLLGEPTAQEQAAAYAAALRRQAYTGSLGNLMGNKGFADYGNAVAGQAQTQQQMLERGQERSAALKSLDSYRGRKRTVKLSDGTSALFDPLTGGLEKVADAAPKIMTAGDKSTISVGPDGKVTKLVDAPPPKPRGAGGGGEGVEKGMWGKFIHDLNPSTGRSGEMGKNQARVNSALRLEQLFQNPEGGVRDLDQREMAELATGLQNLLSPSGHSAGEVQHLIPDTIRGNGAKILEWLTNEPRGTAQTAFVEKMSHTVGREKSAAIKALQASQYAVVPGFAPLFKADRARAEGVLRGQHLDPALLDENFVYKEPAASAGAPASGGLTPEQQKRLDELRAKRASGALK